MLDLDFFQAFHKIRCKKPFIRHIISAVVCNVTANLTLAIGALPITSKAKKEVKEVIESVYLLLLSMGTFSKGKSCKDLIFDQPAFLKIARNFYG